jgi:signal transduction protein with GAF and PtsI domain
MEIVVNEWLLDYLRPDAQVPDKTMAIQFLNAFLKKQDKMVIKGNSSFVDKFHRFMKQFGWDINFKKNFSKLNRLLFLNSDKTIIVDEGDIKELSKEIADKTGDDRYLIELWYSNQERIILTTDARLKEKLNDVPDLNIRLLEEFLQEYLA